MVDLLGADYDVVVRYQGGNNAGHTVINDKGKFILNLLPSGILREDTVNVMGVGMVVDLEHLCGEIQALEQKGVRVTPDNLKISGKATVCLPYHKRLDVLEEERLGDRKQGSTKRGIAPVYADKYMHKSIRLSDLLFAGTLRDKVANILEWKNLMIVGGYGKAPVAPEEVLRWLDRFGRPLIPFICDTGRYLSEASAAGKNILFEAQLGALRDIDFGIHPYTTSSQTLASYAATGAGMPGARLDRVIGVMKAYSSSVGGGPFVTEMEGAEAEALRAAGGEYGAATGRPRRVGAFDAPASRYGVMLQNPDYLALTKLDVLAYMDRIPICTAYEINGERTEDFVTGDDLPAAKPVYEYMDGFKQDISRCRRREDLPKAAAEYIRRLEEAVNCPIRCVSVGPKREDYIEMDH
jgi:adenylosuccinate synthase